jgi:transitional endoplasmic reticulum ATPase
MTVMDVVHTGARQVCSNSELDFLPIQAKAFASLEIALPTAAVVGLAGRNGLGKSLIAKRFAEKFGADYLDNDDFQSSIFEEPTDRWDERVLDLIEERLSASEMLVVDDFTFAYSVFSAQRSNGYVRTRLARLREIARRDRKKLILVGRTRPVDVECEIDEWGWEAGDRDNIYDTKRSPVVEIGPDLQPGDYAALVEHMVGADRAAHIDCEIVHSHAPHLTIRQLLLTCRLLAPATRLDTASFIAALGRHVLRDNMRLNEVEALSFADLPGSGSIAEALETHVVMPFENPEMAQRLGLKARRGVMLFGPPGTGKTAIGRALAHRMKGRFFLIDGTIGTEPAHVFIARVKTIIQQAVSNAPCVLFIDDADNLFSIPHVAGIVRYLLSLLDGLESESASKVCVMMTVMDALKVPEALTRSGRVELWLETQFPEAKTRALMLERWMGRGLPPGDAPDFSHLGNITEGFVAADLRRVMSDARLLHARDVKAGRDTIGSTAYIERAISHFVTMRQRMRQILQGDAA